MTTDFEDLFIKYGPIPEGVGWGSKQSQDKRFSIIQQHMTCSAPFTVIDIGCSYGAFLDYLHERRIYPEYHGIDRNVHAMSQIKDGQVYEVDVEDTNKLEYVLSKIGSVDYAVSCGLLQHLSKETGKEVVRVLYKYASRTIISLRSILSDRDKDDFTEWSLSDIEDIASSISRRFIIDHSYMNHDMTLVLDRET